MDNTKDWHVMIQDLGYPQQGEENYEDLQGLYRILSSFKWKMLHTTAQGLLEIAAYVEQNRAKLEQEATDTIISLPGDRYYVQQLSATEYAVKELSEISQVQPDDPTIRTFLNQPQKAYVLAGQLNEYQRLLDARYGRWMRHAALSETRTNERGSYQFIHYNKGAQDDDFDPFRDI